MPNKKKLQEDDGGMKVSVRDSQSRAPIDVGSVGFL